MKMLTPFTLLVMFFAAGAHMFVLITSPYYLTFAEYIHLGLAAGIMLFTIIALVAVIDPRKYVKQIVDYLFLVIFLLLIVSVESIVKILADLFL